MKTLLHILLLFAISKTACSQNDTTKIINISDTCTCNGGVFAYAEQMPAFPGGEKAFHQYLLSKTNNTKNAGSHVYIAFTIDETGNVCNVRVSRGIPGMPPLDAKAVRIMKESPDWNPGKMNGKNVCVEMVVPIRMPPQPPR